MSKNHQLHQTVLNPSVGGNALVRSSEPRISSRQGVNVDCNPRFRIGNRDTSISVMRFPQSGGQMRTIQLFEGFDICFTLVNTTALPAALPKNTDMLLMGYCVEGRCELDLDNGMHLFMKPNHIVVSTQCAVGQRLYPCGHYQGIEIHIDLDKTDALLQVSLFLGINLQELIEKLSLDKEVFIHSASGSLKTLLQQIWTFRDSGNIERFRLLGLLLLLELEQSSTMREEHSHYLTSSQTLLAYHAADAMQHNLASKESIAVIAQHLQTSPTHLKECFKSVFGENISEYRRRIRMEAAANLLASQKNMQVFNVALSVGYENQGKFAAAFKRRFNMTPLEYKRTHDQIAVCTGFVPREEK